MLGHEDMDARLRSSAKLFRPRLTSIAPLRLRSFRSTRLDAGDECEDAAEGFTLQQEGNRAGAEAT